MEEPIIRKKLVRSNKALKLIQKESRKSYGKVRRNQVKGKVYKMVKLQGPSELLDLTGEEKSVKEDRALTPNEIMERIQNSSLKGLSGNGFSTYQKLSTVISSSASTKYFIINAVECDPGLLHDEWLLHNKKKEIKMGIELLRSCIRFKQVILASKEEIRSDSITCYQVPNRYPMGAEKLLIKEVLGQDLKPEEIPAQKGILVMNIQTVLAIYQIVTGQQEFNSRYLTVADLTTGEAKIVKAVLGSNASSVLQQVLGKRDGKTAYCGGGAMMANPMGKDSVITEKTNFIGYSYQQIFDDSAKCKKCGGCTRHCPMNLEVLEMVQLIEAGNKTEAKRYKPNQCIQCGTCSYYCRAGKNIMDMIAKLAKNQ